MIRATHLRPAGGAEILLKLEGNNATGSVKARAALNMITQARARGELPPGRPVVEPSSGNLGLALAMVCGCLGIECNLVVDPRMTDYSRDVMECYGARVEMVTEPDEKGSWQGSRLARARQIVDERGALLLLQYSNPDNSTAHSRATAREIIEQNDGPPDVCVVGISTGGQMSGIGRALDASGGDTRMVGVDVEGSSIFGGSYRAYRLRGLGLSWWPGNLDENVIGDVYRISEAFAFASAMQLARREGIVSGGAAGAVVAAAIAEAARLDPTKSVVAVIAERGDRYLRQFYDPAWRRSADVDLALGAAEWERQCFELRPMADNWRTR